MFSSQFKTQNVLQIREQVQLPAKAYLVRNAHNVRFCHVENNHPIYNVFVFSETSHLLKLALLLVSCGIVDGFDILKVNGHIDDIQLYRKHYYEYTVGNKRSFFIIKKMLPWAALAVTSSDVKYIVANLIVERCMRNEPIKPFTPVVQMNNKCLKKAA